MGQIAVLCTDDAVNADIRKINQSFPEAFELLFLKNRKTAIQTLNYELPQINILYWNDVSLPGKELVGEILKDPWLHYGASLVLHKGENEAELTKITQGLNLIGFVAVDRLQYYLPRLLRTLYNNRNFLNQWNFHGLVKSNLDGVFELEKDAFDLISHAHLVTNFLFNSNLIDRAEKEVLYMLLVEQARPMIESLQGGKIRFGYEIGTYKSEFSLSATGPHKGFALSKSLPAFLQSRLEAGGQKLVLEVQQSRRIGVVPNFYAEQKEQDFADGEVVFTQGEDSNHLFFIVSGEWEVLVNGRRVSVLSPSDVFMGEMSFLVKNKRTATVRALGPGRLIKISKQEFIETLKDKPYYALFLSRMLAERLVRLHQGKV